MRNLFVAFVVIGSLLMTGCFGESTVKKEENNRYVVPKGMKVVNVSSQYGSVHRVLYRKMRKDEVAETYYYISVDGGKMITIVEEK